MVNAQDLVLADGRTLRYYDTGHSGGAAASDGQTVLWHHGSPQTGAPLEPLAVAAAARGIRLLSYARPSYGGSSPRPGRDVASAARDVEQIADALGVDRFAVMGASGGGPHALACAALLPDRVSAAVTLAAIAPFTAAFDWFDGMTDDGGLRAAFAGREARERHGASAAFDPDIFIPADWAALKGPWSSLDADVALANDVGQDGLIDDDVAFASPWGFDLAQIDVPVLLVQGGQDRIVPPAHADWLRRHCRRSELWLRPADGHISVLDACPAALDWLSR
ncbi:MAG: alpha/beta fold hydrolase [Cellulomonas sp.]